MQRLNFLPALLLATLFAAAASAQPGLSITERDARDLAEFERQAVAAKANGETTVSITLDLPPALWYFDLNPGDPYPAWFVSRASLLKTFVPDALQPYINMEHAGRIRGILEERSRILARLGLKGHWSSTEPQVLPEGFFQAHPKLRGPRVDQPNRARVAHFAPCVDQPEVLELYRQGLRAMFQALPTVHSFNFLTQDSGSGFCWVPALYPGINGHSDCKDRPMEERVAGFLTLFKEVGAEFGIDVTLNMNPITPRQWMLPSFSSQQADAIVRALPRGIALQRREGPDGRRFTGQVGGGGAFGNSGAFYPVAGFSYPTIGGGSATALLERLTTLRATASSQVGEAHADDLLTIWTSMNEVQDRLDALNFGAMIRFGHILGRWINRPLVPFPEELTAEERDYYRRHLFQARSEEQADNLVDIQGMLMYQGWGAKMLFQRVIETTVPAAETALARARNLATNASSEALRVEWDLNARRIEAIILLLKSADNVVAFQAHLDRARELGLQPEINPPLGVQSDWARTDMMEIARREIDIAVRLIELIESTDQPIIDMAPTPEEEYVMRLGPNLVEQLRTKIRTMNSRWLDYDRIFSVPNP